MIKERVDCHLSRSESRTTDQDPQKSTGMNLWEDTAEEGSNSGLEKLNSYGYSDPYEKRVEEDFN